MKYKKLFKNLFKKSLFYQILLLIMLVGIISFLKLSSSFLNNNVPGLATLVINFETEKRFFEGDVIKNMTILDALSAAVSVGKIKLNYAIDKSENVNILEIDGQINGINGKYFVFYLNSKKVATKDLNKKVIRSGDRIEIRYE